MRIWPLVAYTRIHAICCISAIRDFFSSRIYTHICHTWPYMYGQLFHPHGAPQVSKYFTNSLPPLYTKVLHALDERRPMMLTSEDLATKLVGSMHLLVGAVTIAPSATQDSN